MTKEELLSLFNMNGRMIEEKSIYVFGTMDLDENKPHHWIFGRLNNHLHGDAFMIYNNCSYMHYVYYIIPFENFNPYDMEESRKHIISLKQ